MVLLCVSCCGTGGYTPLCRARYIRRAGEGGVARGYWAHGGTGQHGGTGHTGYRALEPTPLLGAVEEVFGLDVFGEFGEEVFLEVGGDAEGAGEPAV